MGGGLLGSEMARPELLVDSPPLVPASGASAAPTRRRTTPKLGDIRLYDLGRSPIDQRLVLMEGKCQHPERPVTSAEGRVGFTGEDPGYTHSSCGPPSW